MGMFTTVVRDDGLSVQVRFGNDFCDTYKTGDEVPIWVDTNKVGSESFIDDVYRGYPDSYIIIKDNRIHDIITENEANLEGEDKLEWKAILSEKYGISNEYYQSLFTEEAWQKYQSEEQEKQEVHQRKVNQWLSEGCSPLDIMGKILSEPDLNINYAKIFQTAGE